MLPIASRLVVFGLELGDLLMNKTKLKYFDKEDILHVAISDEPESGSIEVSPFITAELNERGGINRYRDSECQHFYSKFDSGIGAG